MKLWQVDITLCVVIASEEEPDLLDVTIREALERNLEDRLYFDPWIAPLTSAGRIPEGWHDATPYGVDKAADEVVGDRTCAQLLSEVKT